MKYLLLISFLLLVPNFFPGHLIELPESMVKEVDFDPVLTKRIQDMDDLENFVDSTVTARGIIFESEEYADLLSSIVRLRFFHSYSHYSLRENWLAAVAGRFFWYDLSAIVIPDDILQYPMAACSQQSIVLMEFFKRKRLPFRKIGFDGHFAVEGNMNGLWLYFDTNLKPEFPDGKRTSLSYLLKDDNLKELYMNVLRPEQIPTALGHPYYGKINELPAPQASLFHHATGFLSHWLWLIPLLLYGYISRRDRIKKRAELI